MRKSRHRPRPRPRRQPRASIVPSVSAAAGRAEGRDHRRGDARRDGAATARMPTRPMPRRASTPRTSSRSTARTRRGRRSRPPSSAHRSSSTWATATAGRARTPTTRLHDQGRLRAQRHGRRRRLQQQVLRRAVRRDPGPRAGRHRPAPPPVLRVGQLRAGPRRAERDGRPPARRQLRRRLPQGRRLGGHRRRPLPAPSATCGRCSRPTSRSRTCGARCRTPNGNVVTFPSMRTPGATVFQDPEHPDIGLLPLAGDRHDRRHDRRGHLRRLRRHRRRPDDLVVPGNAAVATEGAGLYSGPDTPAATGGDRSPPGPASASSTSPARRRAEGTPLVQVEGIDDPSIAGFMLATDLAPRDSAAPVVRALDAGRSVLAERRRPGRHGDHRGPLHRNRSPGRSACATPTTTLVFETTGTRRHVRGRLERPRSVAIRVPDGTYTVEHQRRRRLGQRAGQRHAHRPASIPGPARSRASTPGADTTQWFSPNGDGFRDTVAVSATNAETGSLIARVLDADGATRQDLVASRTAAPPRR